MKITIPAGTKLTISSGTKKLAPDDFSPLQLPNLTAWYDATDEGSLTESGGRYTGWADKSGNGNDLSQSTSTDAPFSGRTVSGLNSVDFQGSECLHRSDCFGYSTNPDITVFALVQFDSAASTARYINFGASASGVVAMAQDNSWRHSDGNSVFASPSTGKVSIITAKRNSGENYGQATDWRDDRQGLTQTASDNPSNTPNILNTFFGIGAATTDGNTNPSDCAIVEVIIYNSVLSDEDIAKVESYLKRKLDQANHGADYGSGSFYNAMQKTNPTRYYRMFNSGTGAGDEPDLGSSEDDGTHDVLASLDTVGPQKDITKTSRDFPGTSGQETTSVALDELDGNSAFSVGAWVFNRDKSSDAGIVSGTNTTNTSDTLLFWYNLSGDNENGGGTTNLYTLLVGSGGSGSNRINSQDNAALQGVWQYVVGTMNGTDRKIYVDGVLSRASSEDAQQTTIGSQVRPLWIGDTEALSNWEFDGNIADVAIWDRELSANEIANLYTSACKPNLLTGDLQFDMSTWSTGGSATYEYGTAPDGTTTTNKLENTNGSNFSSVNQLITDDVDYNKVYTISAWIKAISLSVNESTCQVFDSGAATQGKGGLHFNHSTQTITSFGSPEASGYEDAGGGWYRIWWSCVIDEGDKSAPRVYFYTGRSSNQIIGDSLEVWNVQVHEGIGPPAPTLDSRNFPRT